MVQRLVIHLKDPSTDFLTQVYEGLDYTTVIRDNLDPVVMNSLIRAHEQVIMLGHGGPSGLFGNHGRYLINHLNVEALNQKANNIFVWCYASTFVERYNLRGFATGMFISEEIEALEVLPSAEYDAHTLQSVEESNTLFAQLLRENLSSPIEELSMNVIEKYSPTAISSPNKHALKYNRKRLKHFNI